MWMDVDAALTEVPVNCVALIDDTDFKTREESVAYNAAGLELIWHFTTTAGVTTATVVTPTTGGDYDWAHQDGGLYTIEIPASEGASINNDTEGFGFFSGVADGILPWSGPIIGFRDANLNNLLIDSAYSTTRGLAGTALPAAVADAPGGLPISDGGGLNLDGEFTALSDYVDALEIRLTDARAGYLDKLNVAGTLAHSDAASTYKATGFGPANEYDDALSAIAGYVDEEITNIIDAIAALNNITAQEVRDAMKLAPSAPGPSAGSIDKHLDDIVEDTNEVQGLIADSKVAAQVKGMDDDVISAGKYNETDAFPVSEKQSKAASTIAEGTVVADAGNSTTQFKTNLTKTDNDFYKDGIVKFSSGNMFEQGTEITAYNGTTKILTVVAMTQTPAADDEFVIM